MTRHEEIDGVVWEITTGSYGAGAAPMSGMDVPMATVAFFHATGCAPRFVVTGRSESDVATMSRTDAVALFRASGELPESPAVHVDALVEAAVREWRREQRRT